MTAIQRLAYIALGSNIGEREVCLRQAIERLDAFAGIHVTACSSMYQTKPVGMLEQPLFLNMVVELRTTLDAHALFLRMIEVEQEMGRTRVVHWGPRNIDLDLLWFDNQLIDSDSLTVPHPRMHERAFVLLPLLELVRITLPNWAEELELRLHQAQDREDIVKWMSIDWPTESAHSEN